MYAHWYEFNFWLALFNAVYYASAQGPLSDDDV